MYTVCSQAQVLFLSQLGIMLRVVNWTTFDQSGWLRFALFQNRGQSDRAARFTQGKLSGDDK
jgi:hypothetical protein